MIPICDLGDGLIVQGNVTYTVDDRLVTHWGIQDDKVNIIEWEFVNNLRAT